MCARAVDSKATGREADQGRWMREVWMSESASEAAAVAGGSKQAVSSGPEDWGWVDRDIWTERMLAALGNGVRGGKWFSLIDKVYRPSTLRSAGWCGMGCGRGRSGERGAVCGSVGTLSGRAVDGAGGGELSASGGASGGDPEGGRESAPFGDTDGTGPGGAGGGEASDRADIRAAVCGRELWVPPGPRVQGCAAAGGCGSEGRVHGMWWTRT